MTHEELAARYRLIAKSQSEGVESWKAVQTETEQEVNVHRLVTSRQISILDMMAHLDPTQRARIVEQLVVDDVPVVVTEPLPPSTTFMGWLQNSIPSTVTSVIRPLTRPQNQQPAQESASPANAPESLTAIFLATELEARATEASKDAELDAPASKRAGRAVTPPTPLADLAGGLTDIFSASELREKLAPEPTVKRGAVASPAPTATPTPISPTRSTPPTPPAREFDSFALDGGLAEDIPDFRSEPIQPARSAHSPIGDEEPLDSEPPDFRRTFVAAPESNQAAARQPRLDPPPPKLESRNSPYTEVIERRLTPGMPANPALIAPPAPKRQPSMLPVVIVVGVLGLAILGIIVFALLNLLKR